MRSYIIPRWDSPSKDSTTLVYPPNDDGLPLYPSEAQISRRVFGPGRTDEWRALVHILERKGFPQIDPLIGRRYWRACQMWFDARHGIVDIRPGQLGKPDGEETSPTPRPKRQKPSATVESLSPRPAGQPPKS